MQPSGCFATEVGLITLQIHLLLQKQQQSQMQRLWLTRLGSPSRMRRRQCKWIHHLRLQLDLPCHLILLSCVMISMLQINYVWPHWLGIGTLLMAP